MKETILVQVPHVPDRDCMIYDFSKSSCVSCRNGPINEMFYDLVTDREAYKGDAEIF